LGNLQKRRDMSLGKTVQLSEPEKRAWRDLLNEDEEYCKTIKEFDSHIDKAKKIEAEMQNRKSETEFSKHMALVKEYRKWSKSIYTPKTKKIFNKSDLMGETGRSHLVNGYDEYLQYDSKIRPHGGYPHDRVFLDRWDQQQYDPWNVAKEAVKETTIFSGSLDPLKLQNRNFLEEARGLYLLENKSKTEGIPPLRSLGAWLKMPYSYYAWQNSAKWSKHWKGMDEKLPEVPSVCTSGVEEQLDGGERPKAEGPLDADKPLDADGPLDADRIANADKESNSSY